MYKLRNTLGKFWWLILNGVMLAIFLTIASKKEELDPYMGGNSTYTVEQPAEEKSSFESLSYVNPTTGLSMQVPKDWTYVLKDGADTWVHAASASSVQVQVLDYYPMVNNTTAESLAQSLGSLGYNLTEFERTDETSYYAVYQGAEMNGVTDYIENVFWDRSHVVKVILVFSDSNYQKLHDIIMGCIDSINWVRNDPVPEGTYLFYNQTGDYEFAVPTGWTASMPDNTYLYASDQNTGAEMTSEVLEDPTLMSDFSQLDYTNFLSEGKQGFILSAFQQSDNAIYAEASWYSNNIQMGLIQYYIANGKYHYITTYSFPVSAGDTVAQLARNAVSATRVFYVPSDEELQQAESQKKGLFDEQTVGDEYNDALKEMEEKSKELMNQNTQTPDIQGNEENASDLASAIMTLTGISFESANYIDSIWNEAGITSATYAEAVTENDTEICILVTDSENINWYIWIGNDGSLLDIRYDAMDGQSLFEILQNNSSTE